MSIANLDRGDFPTQQEEPWEPSYDHWRHGGWYTTARYPSGACGCVSNNYDDKKWRIACGPYHGLTFSTRRDAANAERALTLAACDAEAVIKELLAACRMLVVWGGHASPATSDVGLPSEDETMQAALAAIAKAEKDYWRKP